MRMGYYATKAYFTYQRLSRPSWLAGIMMIQWLATMELTKYKSWLPENTIGRPSAAILKPI